jgi:hypothetical protein
MLVRILLHTLVLQLKLLALLAVMSVLTGAWMVLLEHSLRSHGILMNTSHLILIAILSLFEHVLV